ncbi:hypothetical protein [Actinomadura alba]|uniref:D-ribose pyranase n=1 Tax=Actinomadura alba TaxID=406431 RepID=A0ABR7M1U6_9ACTN|nr:hypothetical protein [Actinomadura alba]MBC6471097.1 hypothetical protein [Actinomadura alba]
MKRAGILNATLAGAFARLGHTDHVLARTCCCAAASRSDKPWVGCPQNLRR